MIFNSKLEISTNLKQVRYDKYLYNVSKVVRIPKEVDYRSHICNNKKRYSVVFNQIVSLNKKIYLVFFCNRCKKLFLKPLKVK